MSFENLKTNRTDVSKLVSAVQEATGATTQKKSYEDERFWKPSVDESGNGYAVIRFLPAAEGQELPWVRYFDHFFKGPTGQWYVEKSLTSIGQKDPLGELNSRLWNSGIEDDKETARKQKRRLHHVANVLVISDPANPANEGKVFLYDFGKKIMDKIMDIMQPQFPGEEPVNPFDFWSGADFEMKIRNVAGYRNYDSSAFKPASALFNSDETKLETTYNSMYDTAEFVDPTNYKTYDELRERLAVVLGEAVGEGKTQKMEDLGKTAEVVEPKTTETPVIKSSPEPQVEAAAEADDDTLSYFAKLANDE